MTGLVLVSLVIAALFAFAPAASAQEAGEQAFEISLGYYVPGIDDLDNDLSYALRYGSRPSEQWGWRVGLGYFDLNQNNDDRNFDRIGSANAWLVDFDGIWYLGGSDFGLFASVGWATVDVDIQGTTKDVSDDAFQYGGGLLYNFNFGDKYLVTPQIRLRKFEGDTYEKTDEEYSLSFGWRF